MTTDELETKTVAIIHDLLAKHESDNTSLAIDAFQEGVKFARDILEAEMMS